MEKTIQEVAKLILGEKGYPYVFKDIGLEMAALVSTLLKAMQ